MMRRATVMGCVALPLQNTTRPSDVLIWMKTQREIMNHVLHERQKDEKGFVHYTKTAWQWACTSFKNTSPPTSPLSVGTTESGDKTKPITNGQNATNAPGCASVTEISTPTDSQSANLQRSTAKTTETVPPSPEDADDGLTQYYGSQPLRNQMKWKRVTWDKSADFAGFSARLLASRALFEKVPAFSHLSLSVVPDPVRQGVLQELPNVAKRTLVNDHQEETSDYRNFTRGQYTAWALQEPTQETTNKSPILSRTPTEEEKSKPLSSETQKTKRSTRNLGAIARTLPYTIDWARAEVRFLDTATPYEVLHFLRTEASPLMHLQVTVQEEQERLHEAVEAVRFRCTLSGFHFNEHDASLRVEPSALPAAAGVSVTGQKQTEKNYYITPSQLQSCCDAFLRTAWLFRAYLKGHTVRLTAPGSSYRIDKDKRELCIPVDFYLYNYCSEHQRYLFHERIANSYRNHWYVWFFVATVLIGDFDFF